MKVAVWLDANYYPTNGGSFSYDSRLIKLIDDYQFSSELEVCFAALSTTKTDSLSREVIKLNYTPHIKFIEKIKCKIPILRGKTKLLLQERIAYERNALFINTLKNKGVQLIYYINQFPEIINNFPFVITHWDIGHRSSYAFPEFSNDYFYKARENYYHDIIPRALMIFVESLSGQEELTHYTNINKDRTRVVPLFSGECTSVEVEEQEQKEILDKYQIIPYKFFFYPAQFWPEKNHYTLLKAFSFFQKEHPDFKLVFTGDSKKNEFGTESYLKNVAKQLNIDSKVIFGGFVPISHIFTFYKNACSMIMPTFVGPTNMPLLEAMELGCPVICSDLPGHREQLGDAAIYFNPLNVYDVIQAMNTILAKRDIFLNLIKEQNRKSVFHYENAMEAINTHLLNVAIIRETWE